MYWTRILGAPALACAIMLTGCTEDEAGTVTLNLTVNDFTPGEAGTPVPNAEVCVLDTEDCTTTDPDGLAVVALPSNAETGVTITADGFNPTVLAQTTDENFASDQTIVTLADAVGGVLATLLEVDYPPVGVGTIGLGINFPDAGGGIPGATLELTDGTGTGFYNAEDGLPTYDLMATSSSGAGGFVEVSLGVVEIDIGGSPGDCGTAQAWPGTTATSIRLPVRDGFITFSILPCETVGVNVTVLGAEEPFGDSVPLEGAEVCQDGTANCATTDADGVAALQIPGNEEFAYAVTPPSGFYPLLSPQVSDSNTPLSPNLTVFSEATLGAFAALLDTDFPPTTGTIGMVVYENPFPDAVGIPGVSFELIEGTGRSYYLDEDNLPTTMLTETLDNGSGGFVEASEGTLEVGLSGTLNCERPYNAWPGAEPNQFRIPSRAGFLTVPAVWCDAAP